MSGKCYLIKVISKISLPVCSKLSSNCPALLEALNYGNALQVASYGGHEAIVRLLLDKGTNVNAQGGGNYSNVL